MLQNIFIIFWLVLSALIPIVLWGYLFSYFDESELNRKRFLIGIVAGWLSVGPVLYLEDFIKQTDFWVLNIFSSVAHIWDLTSLFHTFLSFFSLLFLISFLPFFLFSGFENWKEKLKKFGKNYLIFAFYLGIVGILFFVFWKFFDNFAFFDKSYDFWLQFGDVVFNSFKLVIFYYIIIAILEELSKFFCFNYSKLFSIVTVKQSILYAIFVALWFAFFENILYFKKLYELHGIGKDLLAVYFTRNLFSVLLHVLCSSVLAYYFSFVYLKFKENFNKEFIKILFIGFFLAILLHWLFDIFLTFGLTFFVIVYIIGSYFYLSYLFYKED